MSYKIEFADIKNGNEISELRKKAYAKADGYTLDLETLNWSKSDDDSYVMIVSKNDKIVSTMRGEVIKDLSVVEQKLECPWSFNHKLEMPVLLLSRAATEDGIKNKGLNLVLRYWFIQFAEKNNISSVIGTFVSGSPRENTLQNMGYQFFENKFGWQKSSYRSQRSVHVAVLDMNFNLIKAKNYCLEKIPGLERDYSLKINSEKLKFVRSL